MRKARDPNAQRAALSLLTRGLGTPGEIAELAGVSRQLVESWANSAGIDWQHVKRALLTRAWRQEMNVERPRTSRRRLRRQGLKAKAIWDRTHASDQKVSDQTASEMPEMLPSGRGRGVP
jgi:hypothetical protein